MNKNLIIAILIIVIVGIAAFMVFSHQGTTDGKLNTQISMLSGTSLQNGDQIEFQLKDDKGNLLSGQTVELGFTDDSGNNETFKVVTDSNGKGYLDIDNEGAGTHDFTATYAGNGTYNGCSIKETITINDGGSDDDSDSSTDDSNPSTASSDQPTSNGTNGSGEYRPAVDSSGITREEADEMGYRYTSEHGGHYIGSNDHWDPKNGSYHD